MLAAAGRLTHIGTLKNPVAQILRNLAGHVMLGLPRVTHAVADTMSEVAIGYPHSPLNGPGLHDGPKPGERVAPIAGQRPMGSGDAPLFTLFVAPGPEAEALLRRCGRLLDSKLRAPLVPNTIWLVRPDGYVAMAAAQDAWRGVADYLDRLAASDTGTEQPETIPMGGLEVRFLRSKQETAGSLDVFEMTVRPDARMPAAPCLGMAEALRLD